MERLLAFMGVAPVAGRGEINETAFVGDGDGAVAGIVRDLRHIKPPGKCPVVTLRRRCDLVAICIPILFYDITGLIINDFGWPIISV